MPEKYSINEVPSAARLAAARRDNRYNLEIDELDKTTAERIKKFCSQNNLFSKIESDSMPGRYKISIHHADLSILERIEGILSSNAGQ